MIRGGNLDRIITIQRLTYPDVSDTGAREGVWADWRQVRAELVTRELREIVSGPGELPQGTITFRTWWIAGVTLADRIAFEDRVLNIVSIAQIGRRRGLEISTLDVLDPRYPGLVNIIGNPT